MRVDMENLLNPADRQDGFTRRIREENGYVAVKRLDDGTYACMMQLMFTMAICMDVDETGFARRYCFEDGTEAITQFISLTSSEQEPTGWIAKRPK